MTGEINIEEHISDRHHLVFEGLHAVSLQVPPDKWCLVGGLMVLLLGAEAGVIPDRASITKDADVVVNLFADPKSLAAVSHALTESGYRLADRFGSDDTSDARCSFVFGRAVVDELCPDGTVRRVDAGRFRINDYEAVCATCTLPQPGRHADT